MMIEFGETQVFEREMTETFQRSVNIDGAFPYLLKQ